MNPPKITAFTHRKMYRFYRRRGFGRARSHVSAHWYRTGRLRKMHLRNLRAEAEARLRNRR